MMPAPGFSNERLAHFPVTTQLTYTVNASLFNQNKPDFHALCGFVLFFFLTHFLLRDTDSVHVCMLCGIILLCCG